MNQDQSTIEIMDLDDQRQLGGFLIQNPHLSEGKFIFENQAQKQLYEKFKEMTTSLFPSKKSNKKTSADQSNQTDVVMINQSIQYINTNEEDELQQFNETKTDVGEINQSFQQQESQIISQIQEVPSNIPQEQQFSRMNEQQQQNLQRSVVQQSNISTGTGEYNDHQSLKDNESILAFSGREQSSPSRGVQFDDENDLNYMPDNLNQGQIDFQRNQDFDESDLFLELKIPRQSDIPNVICLQGLQNNQTINLKDYFIMEMIQEFYQKEWNKLILNLGLQKKTLRTYKLQGKGNYQPAMIEISAFLKQISYLQIDFCYQTNQTLLNQYSSMYNFLQTQGVFVFEISDQFYLVSNQNSEEQLIVLSQLINDNYRGILLYFNTLKSSKPTNYDPLNILGKIRNEYYHQYLKEQIAHYSFNQFSNEQYFLFEMNFSKITYNKELTEKIIKKNLEFHYQNLLLLQFTLTSQSQDQLFQLFVQKQNEIKKKIILQKQNVYILMFGLSADLANIICAVQNQLEIQFKNDIKFFEVKLLKANYQCDIINRESIDIEGAIDLIKRQGIDVQQTSQEIVCKIQNNQKCNVKNLFIILRFWCDLHRDNQNQQDMQNILKQFRQNIEGKQLNAELNFLKNMQPLLETFIKDQINLNIIPQKNQLFTKKEYIQLKSPFLDIVIYNYLGEEFFGTFQNLNCQFEKTQEDTYLIQAFDLDIIKKFKNYFDSFEIEEVTLNEENLKSFEFSFYLKKLLNKLSVNYIVTNGKLALVSRIPKKFQEIKALINNYYAKFLHMAKLKSEPENVKPEYIGLISARIGYMKGFLSPQLMNCFPSMIAIEHLQETEISAFVIMHFSSNMILQSISTEQFEYIYQTIVNKIATQTYVEIRINNNDGLTLFLQLTSQKNHQDAYVCQKGISNENIDLQITVLASKEALLEISQSCDITKFSDETLKNMEFSFYVEQFYPYKNQYQSQEDRKKFRKELEKKGYTVNENQIKWKVQPSNPQQTFSIFSILAEKTMSNQNLLQLQRDNQQGQEKPNIPHDESSIQLIQNKSEDSLYHSLVGQMKEIVVRPKQPMNTDFSEEILRSIILNQEVKSQILEQQKQEQSQKQQQQVIQQKAIINEIQQQQQILLQSSSEINNSHYSGDSNSSVHNFSQQFSKNALLVQFAKERKMTNLQVNDSVVKYLMKREPNIKLECFYPKVDETYVSYFEKISHNITQDVYMIVKPDKEIQDHFSKKIILIKIMEKAADKFLGHKTSILVQVKANSTAKYWVPDKDKPEQICLKEQDQILPYQCYVRKEIQ